MQKIGTEILYSPSDLITFMSDLFSSWMDRRYLENPEGLTPDPPDESAALVQKHGIVHEKEFLASLIAEGKDVCEILSKRDVALAETIAAMQAGREVIYQGYLKKDNFAGLSDFLIRVPGKSKLGDFHYEVWDSKLARKPKPYFLVQLCAYAEMLELIQGSLPEHVAIVLGNKEVKTFRTADYYFFYQSLKDRFIKFQNSFVYDQLPDWPNAGDHSRWKSESSRLLEEQDHLLLVANIRKSQIKKLKAAGINTMTELARTTINSCAGISQSAYDAVKSQARLQIESRGSDVPKFEIIPQSDNLIAQGLHALPPASPLDVFFDMEGYPFMEGGLEYLFGTTTLAADASGPPAARRLRSAQDFLFTDWWAHDRPQEKLAFENFIDWIYQRAQEDPTMHIYHYGAYEVSAIRRLASRHATRETELDELLRTNTFVDLYAIVRHGIRIGSNSYSIKKVEALYMEKREQDVSKATDSIVYYENWLEQKDGVTWQESKLLNDIREYNRVDCESTALLCAWLREQQESHAIPYSRTSKNSTAPIKKPLTANEQLAEQLRGSIPLDRSNDPERWRITELLADLLGFHSRESKVSWWEFYDRVELTEEEQALDPECIARVRRLPRDPVVLAKSLVLDYFYENEQDLKLQAGDTVAFAHNTSAKAELYAVEEELGIIKLKISTKKQTESPLPDSGNLILIESMNNDPLEQGIMRQATKFQSASSLKSCIDDLLRRKIPRLHGKAAGDPICNDGETLTDAARSMDNTYLCVQGPPGSGKTYHAAHSVIDLMKSGKRIGVSSNSHKAIENLLAEIGDLAREIGYSFRGAKVGQDKSGTSNINSTNIEDFKDPGKVVDKIDDFQLVGATAWFFSKPDLQDKFDYLFIDEAGQVSLANLVAMADSCKNMILIGDQLQLEQPVRGSHPGESGLSSLDYLLGDAATIEPAQGIFLSETWRMHPALCRTVSEAVYDGRLHAARVTEERQLIRPAASAQNSLLSKHNGLIYLPVEHQGNSQSSIEEVDLIESLINELLGWEFEEGSVRRKLRIEDILIVAPYNKQVRLIKSRIPIASDTTGSIDKFQGQQAPIVILSMTASDLASSARGLEFLLSKRRLNVAISRAKLLSIVVGSPSFAEYPCSTVEHAALLNFYCRLMQEGTSIKQLETCAFASSSS